MLNEQIETVIKKYQTLIYDEATLSFTGHLFASKIDGDKYFVKIEFAKFPQSFPKVFEIGERIPHEVDRHINGDGSICFCTRSKEEIALATKVNTLCDFIELILVPFLQNNSYFEINRRYKFGEHSHDLLFATYETYKDILVISNPLIIEKTVGYLINRIKFRPNELCFCGSNKKIKNCSNHQQNYKLARKISKDTLLLDQEILRKLITLCIEYNKKTRG